MRRKRQFLDYSSIVLISMTIFSSQIPIFAGNPLLFSSIVSGAAVQSADSATQARINFISREKRFISIKQVKVDTSTLANSKIDIDIGDSTVMSVQLKTVRRDSPGTIVWYGETSFGNIPGYASLSVINGKLHGIIVRDKRVFVVMALNDKGDYLLVQRNLQGIIN